MEKQEQEAVVAAGDKLGYSITYIQDYGSGRQVQIAFGLKPGAPVEAFNHEFDKLRKATDRQRAFITLRDTEAKLGAERKLVAALEHMIESYDKAMEEEIGKLAKAPTANHTATKAQISNMRAQAASAKQSKMVELQQHQTNIAISEAIIEGATKEIEG